MKHIRTYITAVLAVAVLLTACGNNTVPASSYETISGTTAADTTAAISGLAKSNAVLPGEAQSEDSTESSEITTVPSAIHQPEESVTEWQVSLKYLNDGNERYITGKTAERNPSILRSATAKGQKPFAAVITCSDSRDIPEQYFDSSIGDIFTIRVAGNIQDESVSGSVRYAVEHLHVPLVAVVGHTHCGAVTSAVEQALAADADENSAESEHNGVVPADLQYVLDTIKENINTADKNTTDKNTTGTAPDIETAVEENAAAVATLLDEEFGSKTKVIGGIYDIESGKVIWQGDVAYNAADDSNVTDTSAVTNGDEASSNVGNDASVATTAHAAA